jgi:hypothetical protein
VSKSRLIFATAGLHRNRVCFSAARAPVAKAHRRIVAIKRQRLRLWLPLEAGWGFFSGAGFLVLYVSGSFNLQGTAGILDNNPSHVFINYTGASALQTKVGDTVDGFLFIPIANATLDSTFFGGLYGGLLAAGALIRPTHGSQVDARLRFALLRLAMTSPQRF